MTIAIKTTGVQDKFTVTDERCMEYRKLRMGMKVGAVQDIDQLEYKVVGGKVVPLAVIELSKVEGAIRKESAYLSTLYKNRKKQIDCATQVACLLEVDALFIVYEDGLKRIWVMNLHNQGKGWVRAKREDVETYIKKIHGRQ